MADPRRSMRASPRRGFTVIELVVAIAIAAIVSAAIASSLSQLGRARETARLRMSACRRATDALEAIRRDVQSTLRSDDLFSTRFRLAPESVNSTAGSLDRDQMLLFNERLRPIHPLSYSGEGQEYEAQYRIEVDADGSTLWRRRDAVPDEYEDAGGIAEPVGEGVVAVRFEAYDGNEWRQAWDSDVDGLPWSVRATVTASGARMGSEQLDDPRALVTLRTEIPIDRAIAPKSEAPPDASEGDSATGEATAPTDGAGAPSGAGGGLDGGGVPGGGTGGGKGGMGGGKGDGNPNQGIGGGRPVPFTPPGGPRGPGGGRGAGGGRTGPS